MSVCWFVFVLVVTSITKLMWSIADLTSRLEVEHQETEEFAQRRPSFIYSCVIRASSSLELARSTDQVMLSSFPLKRCACSNVMMIFGAKNSWKKCEDKFTKYYNHLICFLNQKINRTPMIATGVIIIVDAVGDARFSSYRQTMEER